MTATARRLLVVPLLLAAGAIACDRLAHRPPAPTPVTVQLQWLHQATTAGFYAAAENGYYAAEGLAVTLVPGGPGVDPMAPVLSGAAQFAQAGADRLILARAAGRPLRAVATVFRRSPVVFITRAESGITRPQQFAGRTIRVTPELAPALHAMTARVGVRRDRYTEVTLPSDLARFLSGDVPVWGAYLNGLALAAQRAGHRINVILPDDYGVHFYADVLFASDELIAARPDLVRRFLRATLRGWTYAVENPASVGPLVARYKPDADPELETAGMEAILPLINTGEDHLGWMTPEAWAGMEKILREQGVLTAPLDVTRVYTVEFVREVYAR